MEKISGILPERPRLRAEKEPLPPVRPGTPGFGRPEGSSDIRDKVTLSSVKNAGAKDLQNYRNPKEARNVKMIEELNRKFFMSPAKNNSKENSPAEELPVEAPFEASLDSPLFSEELTLNNEA